MSELTTNQKIAIAVGTTAAVAVVGYGVYQYTDSRKKEKQRTEEAAKDIDLLLASVSTAIGE